MFKGDKRKQLGLSQGMKVEAEDSANKIVCCATILEIKRDRFKIHFDGWDNGYDFWTGIRGDKVHYVGWCQEMGVPLCPPKGKTFFSVSRKQFDVYKSKCSCL